MLSARLLLRVGWFKLLGAVLLGLSSHAAFALSVEAEGTAPITGGAPGKARILAIQNAIRQAAMQNSVEISTATTLSNHTVTGDSARLRSTGRVSNVSVADEWIEDEILHVLIRAQVEAGPGADAAKNNYRKKIAFMQLLVRDRSAAADLAYIEMELPRLLRKEMESRHGVIGIDGAHYLLAERTASSVEQNIIPSREMVERVAKELGTQFLVAGAILDTGVNEELLGKSRRFEMELMLFDGVSGTLLARSRYHENVIGADFLKPGVSIASAEFMAQPYGLAIRQILQRASSALFAELNALPFTARVIRSDAKKIYFDAGSTSSVRVGDVLLTYRVGDEPMADPASGRFLGFAEQPFATLVVKSVQPQFAVGELETGQVQIKPGDIVRFGW